VRVRLRERFASLCAVACVDAAAVLHREHDRLHVEPEAVDDRAENQRVGIVAREGPAAIDRQVEFVAAEFALHREQFVGQYAPFAVFADLRADEFGDVADRFRQAGCEQVVTAFADVHVFGSLVVFG